jgi:DNA-binding transcriptional regulator YiaG
MPNIAVILKAEITRIARKEIRAEFQPIKKAGVAYRSEIAALKRRIQGLEQEVRRLSKSQIAPGRTQTPEDATSLRFSAKGLASQRRRLGLSADDCGLLLGASGQSVYNWESGATKPRGQHLLAIAELRAMGKREATARLATKRSE